MPSLLLLPLLILPSTLALPSLQRHFGETCSLCECFVEYTDRDVQLPFRPYAQAATPYESSEESCLATCLREEECKAAVYGLVGGRSVFTCELYDNLQGTREPMTAPYTNIYMKKGKCDKPHKHLESLPLTDADDTSLKRRARTIISRPNPFLG